MGALDQASRWTLEDDLSLKHAVETGASLEALAKGAMKFSQKFTVREIQERWHSMLYDPVVSAEASARMFESEGPKINKVRVLKENNCATGKRNPDTVRSSYYALRKRICSESFENMDLSFLVGPTNDSYVGDGDRDRPLSSNPGDPISDPFKLPVSEIHTMANAFPDSLIDVDAGGSGGPKDLPDHDLFKPIEQVNGDQSNKIVTSVSGCVSPFDNVEYSLLPEMPIWKRPTTPALPVDIGLGDKNLQPGDEFHVPDDYAMNTGTPGFEVHSGIEMKIESDFDNFQVHSSPGVYLAELSNSLLNFTNEEELLMNGDGKDFIVKSYFDGFSSLLLNSPYNLGEERVVTLPKPEISSPPKESTANLGFFRESDKASDRCDDQMACGSQVQMQPPMWGSSFDFPEYKNGVICCVLNTEDPDIPCNDDVFLDIPLLSTTAITNQPFQSCSSLALDLGRNQRINERGLNLIHREQEETESHAAQKSGPSHAISNFGVSISNSAYVESKVSVMSCAGSSLINGPNVVGTKGLLAEMQKNKTQEALMANHPNSAGSPIMKPAIVSASNNKCDVITQIRDQESEHAEPMPMNVDVTSEPIRCASALDQGGITFESNGDIPYYADIEAMILDMDLDPDIQDLNANEEVSRFRLEETKRTIIRLEQGAQAHIERDIASHGALAILYGRHSKHYVKKHEVLLGRATNEDIVDIDLGREGQANKISRKQAIITMGKDGSFSLKNISSAPICVNGKEIGFKQSTVLNSSCLIEIRGLPFIFEMNKARVKMYLDSIADATQGA